MKDTGTKALVIILAACVLLGMISTAKERGGIRRPPEPSISTTP